MLHYYHIKIELRLEAIRVLRSRLQLREKLKEKLVEALQAVLPIVAIVLVLSFFIAPLSPSVLLCFLLGAVMIIFGMMFFTLGAEMSMTPMGERVGSAMTKSRSLPKMIVIGFIRFHHYHIGAGFTGTGQPGAVGAQSGVDPFGCRRCGGFPCYRAAAYAVQYGAAAAAGNTVRHCIYAGRLCSQRFPCCGV